MPDLKIGDKAKEAAGKRACDFIHDGMIVGLGTGSTAAFFITHLIKKFQAGLKIHAVATSIRSEELAKKGGIPFLDINTLKEIDIVVDGADEIDPNKQMIKGGGGALLREKILASMAKEMVVIVDESKCVKNLGAFPLPLEIVPFAYEATLEHLKKAGFNPVIRRNKEGSIYKTDNQNYIADLHFKGPIPNIELTNKTLHLIPGVIETGLFLNMAGPVIIGHPDGTTTLKR